MQNPRNAQAVGSVLCAAVLLVSVLLPVDEPGAGRCEEPASAAVAPGTRLTTRVSCAGGTPVRGPARLLFGQRLDLNVASALALTGLPAIGVVRAQALVEERSFRRFEGLNDVLRVRGVGPATVARIAPWVEFGRQLGPDGRGGD